MERHNSPITRLRASLDALHEHIEHVDFDLPSTHQQDRNKLRTEISSSIRDYLLPRLGDLDGDVVAVILGSTGSGKSTLLNSFAGRQVSPTGAVRPTTIAPLVWCHSDYGDAYRSGFFAGVDPVIVEDDDPMLRGVTVVDAPDFDSVEVEHRGIAEDLMTVADLAIFVTSAQRYADAVPWEFLDRAKRRGMPTLFVVNRLPPAGKAGIVRDYLGHLRRRGILDDGTSPLQIEEQLIVDGRLPAATVSNLKGSLERLSDPSRRHELLIRATRGAVVDVIVRTRVLVSEVARNTRHAVSLAAKAGDVYDTSFDEMAHALQDGSLLPGEVASRWRHSVDRVVANRTVGRFLGRHPVDVRSVFVPSVEHHLDTAAAHSAAAWGPDEAGRALLGHRRLWRSDPGVGRRLEGAFDAWVADVQTLLRQTEQARTSQLGSVNTAVQTVVIVSLIGGEPDQAAGGTALVHKLLEQVFGISAAQSLVATARTSLLDRLRNVFDEEAGRFADVVESGDSDMGLRHAAAAVQEAAERFYGG